MNLTEKVKIELNLAHVDKLSKFELVRQVSYMTRNIGQIRDVLDEMKDIDKQRETFYDLFNEPIRESIIKLDKGINKYYAKFCKRTPLRLSSRRFLAVKTESEQPDIFTILSRVDDKFYVSEAIEENIERFGLKHDELKKYDIDIQYLAVLLYQQEKLIECALQVALKNEDSIDVALELAKYLGYITSKQYKEVKEKTKK